MKIIELIINDETDVYDVVIKKDNNIIYRELEQVLKFFKYFDDVINEKSERIQIKIDNKQVTPKDYILMNFIDIQSTINELKYKKSTLLYEYTNIIIENIDYEVTLEINRYLENVFQDIKSKFCFDSHLSFDSNIIKLFNSQSVFVPIISVPEMKTKIEEMINFFSRERLDKKIIIFINSNLIKLNLQNNDNTITFDISNKKGISEYNLLFNNGFQNLSEDLLLNEIKINWPINYIDENIKNNLQKYFRYYYDLEVINTDDTDILIISKILGRLLNLNQRIEYNENKINDIVRSFLKNF